jgi:DNA repair protein RadC
MRQKGQRQLGLFKQDMTSAVREEGIAVYKVCLVREGTMPCYNQQIRSAADASMLLHTYLANVDREHFVVLLLDQKNKVIGIHTVSIGSLTASVVHPRETFKIAILANCAHILIGQTILLGTVNPAERIGH